MSRRSTSGPCRLERLLKVKARVRLSLTPQDSPAKQYEPPFRLMGTHSIALTAVPFSYPYRASSLESLTSFQLSLATMRKHDSIILPWNSRLIHPPQDTLLFIQDGPARRVIVRSIPL